MSGNRRKPHSRAVDRGGEHLLERTELFRQRRLKIEAELNLGIHRKNVLPVLSGEEQKKSGSLTDTEDIGAKISPRNLVLRYVFNSGPIDRVEESLVVQPKGNELLADAPGLGGRTTEELRHTVGKGRLAPRDIDRTTKRSNVVWFHTHRLYKRACDLVNKSPRMTACSAPYTVVAMPAARRKQSTSARTRKHPTDFVRGADGRTANERFREAFHSWRSLDSKTQMDLVRVCNRIAGRPENAEKDYVSQQIIDQIIRDEIDASRSSFTDVLAEALDVRAVWLRLGVGEKKLDRDIIDRVRELLATKG